MSVGRRRYLLPLAFLGIAACFTSASVARAQPPHTLWNDKLTPEQIKAALAKLSLGGDDENDPLHKMLREHTKVSRLAEAFADGRSRAFHPKFLEQAASKPWKRTPARPAPIHAEDREAGRASARDDQKLGRVRASGLKPQPPSASAPSPNFGAGLRAQARPQACSTQGPGRRGPSKGIDDPSRAYRVDRNRRRAPATPEDTLFRPPEGQMIHGPVIAGLPAALGAQHRIARPDARGEEGPLRPGLER